MVFGIGSTSTPHRTHRSDTPKKRAAQKSSSNDHLAKLKSKTSSSKSRASRQTLRGPAMAGTPQHFNFLQPAHTPNATAPVHYGTRLFAAEPRRAGYPNPPTHPRAELIRRLDKAHHVYLRASKSNRDVVHEARRLYKEGSRLWGILEQSENNPKIYNRIAKKYNKVIRQLSELEPKLTRDDVKRELWEAMTHPTYVFENIEPLADLQHQNPYENYTL